ncbi:MAG: MerR family transcriptional regulator [Polaromonas sp.]|nr:MerR family transcriptional regulator [Polaromonas sp.]
MTGIPVSTLRIWEVRHHAFSPSKTTGKHRLYSQEDVHKAGLLKQLSRQGHAISTIAPLQAAELERLQQPHKALDSPPEAPTQAAGTVSLAVIGAGITGRVASGKFIRHFLGSSLRVTDSFPDLAQAGVAGFQEPPQILLVKVNTLHDSIRSQIQELALKQGVVHTLVVYGFAQEAVVQAMREAGILVRRGPVSDYELSDLISSVLLVDTAKSLGGVHADSLIPPRKYSDDTLSRVAGISSNMLCECPRHVAELIAQLASFEQYSQECLNKNEEDAHLHAHLHAISGSARALFERALEMVAQHENIPLVDDTEPPARAAVRSPGGVKDEESPQPMSTRPAA